MKTEEYAAQLEAINSEAEAKRKALAVECAMSNNTVKVGDIIDDHIGRIQVEKISASQSGTTRKPCCIYYGNEINKLGKPKQKNKKRWVWQTNLKQSC